MTVTGFDNITPDDFEYLCRALLRELGFQNLLWRKGGRDRGRDIVAEYAKPEPDGRLFLEKWFIECKHHSRTNPVSVKDLQTKIAWAEAEAPDYLLVKTSSYLTPDAKDWVERICRTKSLRFRYWEDSHLLDLVNRHPSVSRIYLERRSPRASTSIGLAEIAISTRIDHLRSALREDSSIEIDEVLGTPPDRIVLTVHCRAISSFNPQGEPVFRDSHQIVLSFAEDFPMSLPQVQVVTPIVHPHVYDHGTVCYGYRDPLTALYVFLKQLQAMLSSYSESDEMFFVNRDARLLSFMRARGDRSNTSNGK